MKTSSRLIKKVLRKLMKRDFPLFVIMQNKTSYKYWYNRIEGRSFDTKLQLKSP